MDTQYIPYIIDAVLVIIVIIATISCWRRGFLASLFSLVGTAASFVAAFLLSKPISAWVYDRFLAQRVSTFVAEKLPDGLDTLLSSGAGVTATLSETKDKLMLVINDLLGSIGLDGVFSAPIDQAALDTLEYASSSGADAASAITQTVVAPAVQTVVSAAAFLVIFAVAMLVFKLLVRATRAVNEAPLVGGLNQFLGGAFGAAQGLVICYLLVQAALLLIGLTKGSWEYLNGDIMAKTTLASWLASIKLS